MDHSRPGSHASRQGEGSTQAEIVKARPMTSGPSSKNSRIQNGRLSARGHSGTMSSLSFRDPLEIQSSPINLATRSLSARSSTSSLSSSSISQRPASSKSRSLVAPAKKNTIKKSSRQQKKTISQSANNDPNRHPSNSVPQQNTTNKQPPINKRIHPTDQKGFNIAGHLRDSVELDRSSGSLSPDVDQFLKDIGAVMRPLTPDVVKAPTDQRINEQHLDNKQHSNSDETKIKLSIPTQSSVEGSSRKVGRTHRLKVAAQFGGGQPQSSKSQSSNPVTVPKLNLQPKASPKVNDCPDLKSSATTLSIPHHHQTIDPNTAATKIQTWYRRLRSTQLVNIQNVLQEKKDELNRSKEINVLRLESKEQLELERKQRRADKMQAARKAAIEDLNKRREEKRVRDEKIAQEEIAFLKASGKIKKPQSSQKKPKKPAKNTVSSDHQQELLSNDNVQHVSPEAPPQVIDEFFQAGAAKPRPASPLQDNPPKQPKHSNTYDDILETLKLLEEVPAPLVTNERGNPTSTNPGRPYLSAKNLQRLGTPSTVPPNVPLTTSGSLSEGKLHSILAYLDEMEQADQDLLSQLSKSRSEVKTRAVSTTAGISGATPRGKMKSPRKVQNDGMSVGDTDADLEAATAAASDVTATILAQRIELDNKNKTVEMLQKALNQQRELTVYHAKEMDKDGQKKMELLRTEYESRIQRHQSFIDQLIDDKKVLGERCEQLVKQLRELDKKYKTNLKTLEEKHNTEISKLKQVSAAADKLRREKWKADETQRIKEATVKSLEPEIQRIIGKGKAEIQKLKALHEADMMQVDERASRRFVAQMEELRAQCAEEKEHACAHERELARQRYEKLAEQEEINYQQLRRKLFAEVQQEKNRLADQFQQQKVSTDQRIEDMQQSHHTLLEELKLEHARQMSEIDRRHSCEVKELQERSKVEKQAWEENLLKKQDANMLSKEREMREQLRKERDKEIELVITRLEEETTSSKEEVERTAESRVRRVREKYEAELREVERSERSTLEKFNGMKTQVVEHEGELSRLRTILRQKQEEVERVSEVASRLTRERDSVADIVRQEFADRLVRTDEENKDLKIEMSELRARHKVELERVGRDKDREMESVHERVKLALGKKENNLRSLREQYEAALKRADHLEMLLEQQRKQLLKR